MARLLLVALLIVAVIVAYNPQARLQALKAWEKVKPAAVSIANNLYTAIREVLAGNTSRNGRGGIPVPGRGGHFERIVTLNSGEVL